jgi:hypothetical protein
MYLYALLMCLTFNNRQSSTKGNNLYIGFSTFTLMESKTTYSILVLAVTALAMIAAPAILTADQAFAKDKPCPQHGCKGTHGYYYKGTHHHCYKGSKNCVNSKKHGYH